MKHLRNLYQHSRFINEGTEDRDEINDILNIARDEGLRVNVQWKGDDTLLGWSDVPSGIKEKTTLITIYCKEFHKNGLIHGKDICTKEKFKDICEDIISRLEVDYKVLVHKTIDPERGGIRFNILNPFLIT